MLVAGADIRPSELCSVVRNGGKPRFTASTAALPDRVRKIGRTSKFGGVESSSTGEEEVKVAKSETPVFTGVWCKREMLAGR